MTNRSAAELREDLPRIFEPGRAGKSLREMGRDYLKVESRNITSRWYHGAQDVDLFIWTDEHDQVIKQQVSFCGQVVEWNVLDGIKTGVEIEEELTMEDPELNASKTIQFDRKPQGQAVSVAVEVVENTDVMDVSLRSVLLSNFGIRMRGADPAADVRNLISVTPWTRVKVWARRLLHRLSNRD